MSHRQVPIPFLVLRATAGHPRGLCLCREAAGSGARGQPLDRAADPPPGVFRPPAASPRNGRGEREPFSPCCNEREAAAGRGGARLCLQRVPPAPPPQISGTHLLLGRGSDVHLAELDGLLQGGLLVHLWEEVQRSPPPAAPALTPHAWPGPLEQAHAAEAGQQPSWPATIRGGKYDSAKLSARRGCWKASGTA